MLKYENMRYIKSLFIVFAFVFFSYTNAQAFFSKDDIGSTTAQFLKLGIGAHSAGMGNAVTSVYNGTDAIYWNPANLNYAEKKELSFSHTIWFEDVNYEWLAFVLPTTEYGVFGLGMQYVSYGSIDKIDNQQVSDGSISPLDMALYLSYANCNGNLDFGLNFKYIYSKIENSASAIALDLGAKYNLTDKTAIGAALTNFGTEMKFDKETESLPLLFKVGASHRIIKDWIVSLDLNFPNDNEVYVNVGTEYNVEIADNLNFDLRAGYEGRNKDIPGFNWINLGFGFEYLDYIFDYAFVPYGDIGMTHRFSFSIKFGKQVEKDRTVSPSVPIPFQTKETNTKMQSNDTTLKETKESDKQTEQNITSIPTQQTQTKQQPEIKETAKPAEKTDVQKKQAAPQTEKKEANKQVEKATNTKQATQQQTKKVNTQTQAGKK